MAFMRRSSTLILAVLMMVGWLSPAVEVGDSPPDMGRDTVLVWNIRNHGESSKFVVRLAEFSPARYIEWENATIQGTILMTEKAVQKARKYVSARLFEAGVDLRRDDATTVWLSRDVYRDLKQKQRVKIALDSIDGWLTVEGYGEIAVDVNRSPTKLPVMKIRDDRGQERWFLDFEDNPLLARHAHREYEQILKSISTDRPNTLRWIKGKKLSSPR